MLGNGIASGEDMPVFLKKLLLLRVCPLENLQFTILSVVCLKKKKILFLFWRASNPTFLGLQFKNKVQEEDKEILQN